LIGFSSPKQSRNLDIGIENHALGQF